MVPPELQLINFKDHRRFWNDYNKKLIKYNLMSSPASSAFFKDTIKEWYGWDIEVIPHDVMARAYMKPEDYTWFILKWQ